MYPIDHKSDNLITLHPMLIFLKKNCETSMVLTFKLKKTELTQTHLSFNKNQDEFFKKS